MKKTLLVLLVGVVLAGCEGEKAGVVVASAGSAQDQAILVRAKALEKGRVAHQLVPLTRAQMGFDGGKKEGK